MLKYEKRNNYQMFTSYDHSLMLNFPLGNFPQPNIIQLAWDKNATKYRSKNFVPMKIDNICRENYFADNSANEKEARILLNNYLKDGNSDKLMKFMVNFYNNVMEYI